MTMTKKVGKRFLTAKIADLMPVNEATLAKGLNLPKDPPSPKADPL